MTRLDEIEARANAATEGPWEAGCNDRHVLYVTTENEEFCAEYGPELYDSQGFFSDADTEFIAHARQDVPALVAALRAVLELHAPTPSDIYPHDVCHHPHCTDPTDQMEQSPWPCPTVTIIRQRIGEDD